MGYDMYWRNRAMTSQQEAARAAARADWQAAIEARDVAHAANPALRSMSSEPGSCSPEQEAVWAASRRLDAAEVNYFRLNVWGMSAVLDLLIRAEVVHDKMEDQATPWPTPDDFGLTDYPETEDYVGGEWVHRALTPAEQEYIDARTQKLAEGVEYPGIPIHKLCSNDGWIVTPIECLSAGKQWEANRDRVATAECVELTDRFVAWLVTAAEHDGVEVH